MMNATARLEAALKNKEPLEAIRTLIESGVDVNAQDARGRSPLMLAAQHSSDPAILRCLIAAGGNVNIRDNMGLTPLVLAALYNKNPEMVRCLIEAGGYVGAKDDRWTFTMLSEATCPGTVSYLIRAGADVNVRNEMGLTPLIFSAAHGGTPQIIRCLLASGGDVNARDGNGNTALFWALRREPYDARIVKILREAGAVVSEARWAIGDGAGGVNIYRFLRSHDIAAYCREIGHTWNTFEMAVIVARSTCPMAERHAAWQVLIERYPDMPAPRSVDTVSFGSIHEKLREIMVRGEEEDPAMRRLADSFCVDIPTPFKRGDILTFNGTNLDRYPESPAFVLDSFDDPELLKPLRSGEYAGGSCVGLSGWGLFVSDSGVLYSDRVYEYDCFEYCREKLEGAERLLRYVHQYLQDQIQLPALLAMQVQIVLENQLVNHLLSNIHGLHLNSCSSSRRKPAHPGDDCGRTASIYTAGSNKNPRVINAPLKAGANGAASLDDLNITLFLTGRSG